MLIAFFEQDSKTRAKLKEWLVSYTIRRNVEFDVLWFSVDSLQAKAEKYAQTISFAFVSLDDDGAAQTGLALTRKNPDCCLCYYKRGECSLLPLLRSRPFEFFRWTREADDTAAALDAVLDTMLSEYLMSRAVLAHESRRGVVYYPLRNILYLQSDLKYVNIKTTYGGGERIFAKLSDMERELREQKKAWCFVRIHKSYIVNQYHIERVDKQTHTVWLSSGESLPISEACYKSAMEHLRAFHASADLTDG